MYGPVLEGARVKLRPHKPSDAKVFVVMLSDPEVTRYLARRSVPSLTQERAWIEERATDPNSLGWTIEVDGAPVGIVGMDNINWQRGIAKIGTFIGDKSLWKQGVATEMGQLVKNYVFTNLPLRKLQASWFAPNEASGALQARMGFVEIGRRKAEYFVDGQWVDEVLMELYRSRSAEQSANDLSTSRGGCCIHRFGH